MSQINHPSFTSLILVFAHWLILTEAGGTVIATVESLLYFIENIQKNALLLIYYSACPIFQLE